MSWRAGAPVLLLGVALVAGCGGDDERTRPEAAGVAAPDQEWPPRASGALQAAAARHDAGSVRRGEEIRHEFVLWNHGAEELRIRAIPACGCTVAEYDEVIPAGGSGRLVATIDTAPLLGQVSLAIEVRPADPAIPRLGLSIEADVWAPILVEPTNLVAFSGRMGAVEPIERTVRSRDGAPFEVLGTRQTTEHFAVALEPIPAASEPSTTDAGPSSGPAERDGGHAAYRARVSIRPGAPLGPFGDTIVLRTSHPDALVDLRVKASLKPSVTVRPISLYFVRDDKLPSGGRVRAVRVRGSQADFVLTGVHSSDAAFRPELRTIAPGREYEVTVAYVGTDEDPGPGRGLPRLPTKATLTLQTNDAWQPLVRVPIVSRL